MTMTHHAADGTFRNPWPSGELQRFPGLLRWWWDRVSNGVPPDPDPSVFERAAPAFRAPRAPTDVSSATWIGHAATLLQIGGRNVLTDPMFGDRASPVSFAGPRRWVPPGIALNALPPIDVVLLSHNHYDHLHVGSVRALATRWPDAAWFVPTGVATIVRQAGVKVVRELDWWDVASHDGLTITATPAQHFSARGLTDRNRTLWCGFAVAAAHHRIYFAGDTGYHPDFAVIAERCAPFDLALLPIGAYEPRWFMQPVHMNPEEAVSAFTDLGGRDSGVMGAIHWGTFKLTDEPMDEPPRRVRDAWTAAGLPEKRLWVPRHGETIDL
jgi:N-acyl-phosphatidylethanolamine-hydrolysing phospholipase D